MTGFALLGHPSTTTPISCSEKDQQALLNGEILLHTEPCSPWSGAVTAQIYLPLERSHAWQQLIDYPRWVQYFPDLTRSEVIHCGGSLKGTKRLYQVASKTFLLFTAQVEVYLKVFEIAHPTTEYQIQFCLEKGNFSDFAANLKLQAYRAGTLLTYAVRATPSIPIPTILIQEAMRLDLPANMRRMRQVLCADSPAIA